MKLVRLEIGRLPGLARPLVVEEIAKESCNFVVGPNSSGKSSLVRALRLLLGEGTSSSADLELRASFVDGERTWEATRLGREVTWTVDGRRSDRPPLPDGEALRPYRLDMKSLLGADEEGQLLAELRRGLQGGCDLDALRRREPFYLGPRQGRTEAKALTEARHRLREVERSRAELRRDEARLPELEADLEAARRGAQEARELGQALELLEACREVEDLEASVAAFPPSMECLFGDEGSRLAELEGEGERLKGELDRLSARQETAQSRLDETGLAEGGPDPLVLSACSRDLVELKGLDESLDRLKDEAISAAGDDVAARESLRGQTIPPRLDPSALSEAEALAAELHGLEISRREWARCLDGSPKSPDPSEIEACGEATRALRQWLAAEEAHRPWLRPFLALSTAGLLGLAALAFHGQSWPLLGTSLVAALPLVGAFLAASDGRKAAQERYGGTFDEPPWRREAVSSRLRELEARGAELIERRSAALRAEVGMRELERIDAELVLCREKKDELALRIGFDPALTALGFHAFVKLVDSYRRAQGERSRIEALMEDRTSQREALLEGVRAVVTSWETVDGEGQIVEAFEALRRRSELADEARRALAEAGREREHLQTAASERQRRERVLFESAGLAPQEKGELLLRLERLPAWRKAREELLSARSREALLRRPLEGRTDLLGFVEAGDETELRRRLSEAETRGAALQELEGSRARIRAELAVAGEGVPLEGALADVEKALRALEKKRDQAHFAELASFLLDDVEAEHRVENEPELIRNGRELFGRLTGHAFELHVDDGGFYARDCSLGAERSLDELSSATRMGLLLALRLAWIERIEAGGPALPLFFDEALTNSDVERFAQAARSLDELARGGRQIFYLSARSYEEVLWREATGRSPHRIDLCALRGEALAVPQGYDLVERSPLPSPEGHSAESYAAALSVAPIDPLSPDGLPLFHLLRDDLELLHDLMERWRLSTLGSLESFLGDRRALGQLGEAAFAKLRRRVALARIWCDAWRRGRGRPVEASVLEASEALSPTFSDRILSLVRDCDGDGAALVAALRAGQVSRFRTEKIDQIESHLLAEGYIDEKERLDEEGRRRVLLLEGATLAQTEEMNAVMDWLEAGCAAGASGPLRNGRRTAKE